MFLTITIQLTTYNLNSQIFLCFRFYFMIIVNYDKLKNIYLLLITPILLVFIILLVK